MTKNQIISQLYESRELDELISKIQPSDLQDDLRQYVFHMICEKPDEFVISLHEKKQLKFFVVKIITNSVFSNQSAFYRMFRKKHEVCTDVFSDVEDEESNHEMIDKCEAAMKDLYWYHQEILKMYVELGNYRKVSLVTGIPLTSIHNAVKKAKSDIKKNLWK